MMAVKVITPATFLPVSLDETKLQLRVDHTDEDELITLAMQGATEYCASYVGRALGDSTWQLTLNAFPTGAIEIPMPPLISVTSVKYDDAVGEQTLAATNYIVDAMSEPGWLVPKTTWPTSSGANSVRVVYRAGYMDASAVPADIKQAVLLSIGSLYASREEVVIGQMAMQLPWGARALLNRKRVELWMDRPTAPTRP